MTDMTRTECLGAVSHPGKFEGCQPYVPYYWAIYLDGFADLDDGYIVGFNITAKDRSLFPELKGRRTVRLYERNDGFVIEV